MKSVVTLDVIGMSYLPMKLSKTCWVNPRWNLMDMDTDPLGSFQRASRINSEGY